MNSFQVRGYTDRPSAKPGETISVHLSGESEPYDISLVKLIQIDGSEEAPGLRMEEVHSVPHFQVQGRRQKTQAGSFIRVHPAPQISDTFSCFAFIQARLLKGGRQAIISRWDDYAQAGWSLEIDNGKLVINFGNGVGNTNQLVSDWYIFEGAWYGVGVTYNAETRQLQLHQYAVINSTNSRFGPVVKLDSSGVTTAVVSVQPRAGLHSPLIIGGVSTLQEGEEAVTACFNGKVDAPRIFNRPLSAEDFIGFMKGERTLCTDALAWWDFAEGIGAQGVPSEYVFDISGNGSHGICVNTPYRAMTGWNWNGRADVFTQVPEQYGAIQFHADAMTDCDWPADFAYQIPQDLKSGAYAFKACQRSTVDYIPFFLAPSEQQKRAPIAVVFPTVSYMAYANYRNIPAWEGWGYDTYEVINGVLPLGVRDFEMQANPDNYGLSTYDRHADGHGVQYATWRRPILDARPEQPFSWNFQADFYLTDWLDRNGFEYDVLTDHDLHFEGAKLLDNYKVVLTGSHPEYSTWEMLDAYENYVVQGGRAMYLGGNGFYWVTALHPEKPWLAEIRRGITGDAAWHGEPGQFHHAFTGEKGGLWRHRGRAPQKIWGTGYSAHTLGAAGYYVRMPDSLDPRTEWMFEGVGKDEPIGDTGLVSGGAAAIELDCYDLKLGSPPNTLIMASSTNHDQNAMLTPEEIHHTHPCVGADEHPKIRADICYYTSGAKGAVFSASAIGWTGALSINNDENAVSRITSNVLKQFMSEDPLTPIVES